MKRLLVFLVLIAGGVGGVWYWRATQRERLIAELRERLDHLESDRLVADVAVLGKIRDPQGGVRTRLSFVEYGPDGKGRLFSKTFEVRGDEFYIDALVVRFEDRFVEVGDGLRGKGLLLFRRAFGDEQKPDDGELLYGPNDRDPVPAGLHIEDADDAFQREIWSRFWTLASDPDAARQAGVRVAQGEAPHVHARLHQVYELTLRASGGLEIKPRLPAAVLEAMDAAPASAPAAAAP